jgi:hypothetical protein
MLWQDTIDLRRLSHLRLCCSMRSAAPCCAVCVHIFVVQALLSLVVTETGESSARQAAADLSHSAARRVRGWTAAPRSPKHTLMHSMKALQCVRVLLHSERVSRHLCRFTLNLLCSVLRFPALCCGVLCPVLCPAERQMTWSRLEGLLLHWAVLPLTAPCCALCCVLQSAR